MAVELLLTAVESPQPGRGRRRWTSPNRERSTSKSPADPAGGESRAGLLTGPAPFGLTSAVEGSDVMRPLGAGPAPCSTEPSSLARLVGRVAPGSTPLPTEQLRDARRRILPIARPARPDEPHELPVVGGPWPAGRGLLAAELAAVAERPGRGTQSKATFHAAGAGGACRSAVAWTARRRRLASAPKTYRGLTPGPHTFKVVPLGGDSKVIAKSVTFGWRVVAADRGRAEAGASWLAVASVALLALALRTGACGDGGRRTGAARGLPGHGRDRQPRTADQLPLCQRRARLDGREARVAVFEDVEDAHSRNSSPTCAPMSTKPAIAACSAWQLNPKFTEGRPYVYALYAYDHILGDPTRRRSEASPKPRGDPCCRTSMAATPAWSSRHLVRLKAMGDRRDRRANLFDESCPGKKNLVRASLSQPALGRRPAGR